MSRPALGYVRGKPGASHARLISNVRRLMLARGLDQRAIERMTRHAITQAALSYILSGKNNPKLHSVDVLAKVLKVKPWELLQPTRKVTR